MLRIYQISLANYDKVKQTHVHLPVFADDFDYLPKEKPSRCEQTTRETAVAASARFNFGQTILQMELRNLCVSPSQYNFCHALFFSFLVLAQKLPSALFYVWSLF